MLLTTLGAAQTQRQLDEKYPKVNAYLVRPNILLTAKYSTDGRVCEMALQPVRWTGDNTVLLFPRSQKETIPVVEEIVPESERGEKLGGLFGTDDKVSKFSGHSVTTFLRLRENYGQLCWNNGQGRCRHGSCGHMARPFMRMIIYKSLFSTIAVTRSWTRAQATSGSYALPFVFNSENSRVAGSYSTPQNAFAPSQ
jgi:hypothetical protein